MYQEVDVFKEVDAIMRKHVLVIVFAMVAGLVCSRELSAVDLYNTTGSSGIINTNVFNMPAIPFTTTPTGYIVTSVNFQTANTAGTFTGNFVY